VTSLARWVAKKLARGGVAVGSFAAGRTRAAAGAGPSLRVLTYHGFGHRERDPFCVAPADFARQMEHLARLGCAVSLDQVENFVTGRGGPLPDGAILVSIDDGLRSTLVEAAPVLRDHGIPAVAFVTPGLLTDAAGRSAERPYAEPAEPYLTWDELAKLADAGVAIGSHGWSHRSLGRIGEADAEREGRRSREALEGFLGRRVTTLAYPFGTRADYGTAVGAALARCGYTCAFTSQHGAIPSGHAPYELPRIKVEGGEPLWMFRLLVRGGMDGWSWVDKRLWRLQASP
jgi:peptidoglycan/xylan/chitin deacetylase (PgdA/CDA1 family)